jgi:N-acetylglucosamine-6-phosphate deacetylase
VSASSRLRGRAIVGGIERPDVVVDVVDGRIVSVGDTRLGGGVGRGAQRLSDDLVLAPGFVDIHVHGAGGANAMDGPEAIRHMAATLAARGVTSFLPTAVSAPLDRLATFAGDVARVMQASDPQGATVLNANLEGPALDPGHAGAHAHAALVDPAVVAAAFTRDPAAWDAVRVVTVAPERPGGLDLVRLLAARGIVASIGHSGASYAQSLTAYDAGARSTTHLFNAMTGLTHRGPGLALAALLDPRPAVELIADGLHVDAVMWLLVRRLAGSRVVLVSDALPDAGLTGDRSFRLGGLQVTVRNGRATLADGTLAGSMIMLADAVVRYAAQGASLAETVAAAGTRPARLVGARRKGRIARGADADLVAVRSDGSVARVWLRGRELDLA